MKPKINPEQARFAGKIWWLSSYPKSGNTWLRALLYGYMYGSPVDVNRLYRITGNDTDPRMYQNVSIVNIENLEPEIVDFLRSAALFNLCASHVPCDPLLVKTHHQNHPLLIPPLLTNGAIHIIRDPRDVVISLSYHQNVTIDEAIDNLMDEGLGIGAKSIPSYVGSWINHVRLWTEIDCKFPVLIVRYEDMKADTAKELRRVLDFISYEINESRVLEAVEAAEFSKLRKSEENGFNEAPPHMEFFFREGKIGGWRNVLTEEQIAKIEQNNSIIMKKFGYELVTERVKAA